MFERVGLILIYISDFRVVNDKYDMGYGFIINLLGIELEIYFLLVL